MEFFFLILLATFVFNNWCSAEEIVRFKRGQECARASGKLACDDYSTYCPVAKTHCECKRGFIETPDHRCVHTYNESCKYDGDCASSMRCTKKGICGCAYPTHQMFDKETGSCRGALSAPCNTSPEMSCLDSMVCLNDTKGPKCVCDVGSLPMIGQTPTVCALGIYHECTPDHSYECKINKICKDGCDSSRGLKCIDERCNCDLNHVYNYDNLRCKGLEGAECDLDGKSKTCAEGTSCQKKVSGSDIGICRIVMLDTSGSNVAWIAATVILLLIVIGYVIYKWSDNISAFVKTATGSTVRLDKAEYITVKVADFKDRSDVSISRRSSF